jgi:mono/diheme cytochrome c family protein
MLKRIVTVVEVLALASFVLFVALLLLDQPSSKSASPSATAGPVDGAAVYDTNCATCHGSKGQGGVGPKLSDGAVTSDFRDAQAEIVVVSGGRDGMPAFQNRLSPEELEAVVDFTRTGLQQR